MVYANQLQYYDAITTNSNVADSGPFIDFMLGEIQKALEAHKREPIKKVPDKIPDKLLQAFPEMQSMAWSVYLQIAANGHLTTMQMAETLGISDRMVRKHINTLKAKGLITCIGSNKTGHCFQIGKRSDTARLFENHGYKNKKQSSGYFF